MPRTACRKVASLGVPMGVSYWDEIIKPSLFKALFNIKKSLLRYQSNQRANSVVFVRCLRRRRRTRYAALDIRSGQSANDGIADISSTSYHFADAARFETKLRESSLGFGGSIRAIARRAVYFTDTAALAVYRIKLAAFHERWLFCLLSPISFEGVCRAT